MEEKKLELGKEPGFQEDEWAIIKKFTYRERTKLTGKGVSLDENNKPEIDVGQMQFYAVVYGLKDASFLNGKTSTDDKVNYFENSTRNYLTLFKEISNLNNMDNMQALLKK